VSKLLRNIGTPQLSIAEMNYKYSHQANVNYFDMNNDNLVTGLLIINTLIYPFNVCFYSKDGITQLEQIDPRDVIFDLDDLINKCTAVRITYKVDEIIIPNFIPNFNVFSRKYIYESRFIVTRLDFKFNENK